MITANNEQAKPPALLHMVAMIIAVGGISYLIAYIGGAERAFEAATAAADGLMFAGAILVGLFFAATAALSFQKK